MFDERADLLESYANTPPILRALLRTVGDATAGARPADADWAIVEVVAHLADTDVLLQERVRVMTSEDQPVLEPFQPEAVAEAHDYRHQRLSEALDRFVTGRAETMATLEALDDAAWSRTGAHRTLGVISIQQLLVLMATHDTNHLAQIARILSR